MTHLFLLRQTPLSIHSIRVDPSSELDPCRIQRGLLPLNGRAIEWTLESVPLCVDLKGEKGCPPLLLLLSSVSLSIVHRPFHFLAPSSIERGGVKYRPKVLRSHSRFNGRFNRNLTSFIIVSPSENVTHIHFVSFFISHKLFILSSLLISLSLIFPPDPRLDSN